MDKKTARSYVKRQKAELDIEYKHTAASEVFSKLEQVPEFIRANKILAYHSLPDELSTIEFIAKWSSYKQLFLPRVNGVDLEILPYDASNLHTGAFNIEEPDGTEITSVDVIDLIIVPGVAFDLRGMRVGRGKGFYDRLLARTSVVKIGVAYDFQIVDEIYADAHDIPVDIVITDKRFFRKSHRRDS